VNKPPTGRGVSALIGPARGLKIFGVRTRWRSSISPPVFVRDNDEISYAGAAQAAEHCHPAQRSIEVAFRRDRSVEPINWKRPEWQRNQRRIGLGKLHVAAPSHKILVGVAPEFFEEVLRARTKEDGMPRQADELRQVVGIEVGWQPTLIGRHTCGS